LSDPPNLFTAHEGTFIRSVGKITEGTLDRIVDAVISILRP
jgi:hypothetical protein